VSRRFQYNKQPDQYSPGTSFDVAALRASIASNSGSLPPVAIDGYASAQRSSLENMIRKSHETITMARQEQNTINASPTLSKYKSSLVNASPNNRVSYNYAPKPTTFVE